MRTADVLTILVAFGALADAGASIVPVTDNRVVHAQGSVLTAAGKPLTDFDSHGADGFVPWTESAGVAVALPGAEFLGSSTQDSQIDPVLLTATGTASMELTALPGAVAAGNSCSHFVLVFDVVEPTSVVLSGLLDAAGAVGAADSYALAALQEILSGDLVIDEITVGGPLVLDERAVLAPGTYEIRVESHCVGSAEGVPGGPVAASFDIELAVESPKCPDLDGDGTVGINDLLSLLAGWGSPWGMNDLLGLLAGWGSCG